MKTPLAFLVSRKWKNRKKLLRPAGNHLPGDPTENVPEKREDNVETEIDHVMNKRNRIIKHGLGCVLPLILHT